MTFISFFCLGIKYNMGFQQPRQVSFPKQVRETVPTFSVQSATRDGSGTATGLEMKP